MKKNLDFLRNIYIAHRGLHNISEGIPENSLVAFQRALERNIAIELDVHLLRDNTVVVFHDHNLLRICGIDKKIEDCGYMDIENLKLSNTNNSIPTLRDVLTLVNGRVPLIIEIKTEKNTNQCCLELIDILNNYSGLFVIKSFNPMAVYYFRKYSPKTIRGMLASNFRDNRDMPFIKKFIISNLIFYPLCKPDFLSLNYNILNNKRIKKIKQKYGMIILGWTFRSSEELVKYKDLCDSYICEEKRKIYIK